MVRITASPDLEDASHAPIPTSEKPPRNQWARVATIDCPKRHLEVCAAASGDWNDSRLPSRSTSRSHFEAVEPPQCERLRRVSDLTTEPSPIAQEARMRSEDRSIHAEDHRSGSRLPWFVKCQRVSRSSACVIFCRRAIFFSRPRGHAGPATPLAARGESQSASQFFRRSCNDRFEFMHRKAPLGVLGQLISRGGTASHPAA